MGENINVLAENVLTVKLSSDAAAASANWSKLNAALIMADGVNPITVRIAGNGIYPVSQIIFVRSKTIFDLNGCTIKHVSSFSNNLIRNCKVGVNVVNNVSNCELYTASDYLLSTDITIKNGTIDGRADVGNHNLVNIGNATNIIFSNMKFMNNMQGHLVELTGCKNATIENCEFSCTVKDTTSENEALQLDICAYKERKWNGVYYTEDIKQQLPCVGITVKGCLFKNYPSGVGNHHAISTILKSSGSFDTKYHNKKIIIQNNRFENTVKMTKNRAIWAYDFEESTISENHITGEYTYGIAASAGNVDICNNTFGTASKKFSGIPIYITIAHPYLTSELLPHTDVEETLSGGHIDDNEFYSDYNSSSEFGLITVKNASKVFSVSRNKIYGSLCHGVFITKSYVSGGIANNIINDCTQQGILVCAQSQIERNIDGNTITGNSKSGVAITSSEIVGKIMKNSISNCKSNGIHIGTDGIAKNITDNTIDTCKNGIYCGENGTIASVTDNKISSCTNYGILCHNITLSGKIKATGNTFSQNKKNTSGI